MKFREWWPRPYIRHMLLLSRWEAAQSQGRRQGWLPWAPALGSSNCLDAELGLGERAREGRTETGTVEGGKGGRSGKGGTGL